MTGGGVGFGFCGLHLRASNSFVYVKMNPDGVGKSCDYNNDGVTDVNDWADVCLDASTLSATDSANCDTLKTFTLATLGRAQSLATGATEPFQVVAPLTASTPVTFELNTLLNTMFTQASTFTNVSEFNPK